MITKHIITINFREWATARQLTDEYNIYPHKPPSARTSRISVAVTRHAIRTWYIPQLGITLIHRADFKAYSGIGAGSGNGPKK